MVKSHKLQLVLLTLTVLCIDVNYASDVLANTFSYTNFQRTGDIEEYLFLAVDLSIILINFLLNND